MSQNYNRIFLSPPHMHGNEINYIEDAFKSNWIAPLGPNVDLFEMEMAQKLGIRNAVALSSGTAALHLALHVLNLKKGDTVWCSSLTFAASANPIVYEQCTPVFIDSDLSSWCCDPGLLAEALDDANKNGTLPKAVIIVDLYGQCADWDPIIESCSKYQIPIIEDAAEALGSKYKGRFAGTFANSSIVSFNGNKIITTSGGGMFLSNDNIITNRVRFLASQARDPAPHYQHSEVGYNYKMSNLLAGVGRGQLNVLDQRVLSRRKNCKNYQELLGNIPGISFMPEATYGSKDSVSNRWLTVILIDAKLFGVDREVVRIFLESQNIESRPVWKPMHMQPVFQECRAIGGKNSEYLFSNGLCLPSGSNMDSSQIERISTLISSQMR